jgi:hypothetical protein
MQAESGKNVGGPISERRFGKFEHGVLTLTLSRAEQVKPKLITVKTK